VGPDWPLEFVVAAPGHPVTHSYRGPHPRSSDVVHLRPARPLTEAERASGGGVVLLTRPRGYFGIPRDVVLLDGAPPPELRPGVAIAATATRRLPAEAARPHRAWRLQRGTRRRPRLARRRGPDRGGGARLVAAMRILLINANTSADITGRLVGIARGLAPAGVDFVGATGRFGARYIASRAANAIAAHAALDAYAEHGGAADAVLLGCFGDPGLDALREIAPVPVVGLADASAEAAMRVAKRFGVVTGGAAWGPMLEEFFAARGHAARLAGVRTVAPSGGEIARDPDAALALLAAACTASAREDGAEAVILGGAGLAGLAARLEGRVPVPVICSVEAGVRAAIGAVGAAPARLHPHQPVETVGLGAALAKRLG
jgi:Asp/Glu/hydantoin racemase